MEEKIIYALGYFDGVHLGHQALLKLCRKLAQDRSCLWGVVTFSDHPDVLLQGKSPELITTPAQRECLLREQGVQRVVQLPFDEKMMNTPWQDFIMQLIRQHHAAGFVCGSDFRFGKGGEGTASMLQAFCEKENLPFAVLPQQYIENIRVSSTHIRNLLRQGNMEEAEMFLGHPFGIFATVTRGQQLGRQLGFPTANLVYPEEMIRLPFGVYACRVWIDGKPYKAVTNIGSRPTVNGSGITVESYIMNFSADLYGKAICVQVLKFMRPEQKFQSVEELKMQIAADCAEAEAFLQ